MNSSMSCRPQVCISLCPYSPQSYPLPSSLNPSLLRYRRRRPSSGSPSPTSHPLSIRPCVHGFSALNMHESSVRPPSCYIQTLNTKLSLFMFFPLLLFRHLSFISSLMLFIYRLRFSFSGGEFMYYSPVILVDANHLSNIRKSVQEVHL